MGITEVPAQHSLDSSLGTKLHSGRPQMCYGTLAGPETDRKRNSQVVKRSLHRAFNRALHTGFAWYRGQQYTLEDFAKMGWQLPTPLPTSSISQAGLCKDWQKCNQHHSPRRRLSLWQWNSGGLEMSKLDEIKAWLVLNAVDIGIVVETRWTFDSEWSDTHFHHLHTGAGPHRGKGILIFVSTRLCSAAHIKWQIHDSGRLAHVRLQSLTRPVDIVACYQHTFQPNRACHQRRAAWWTLLDHVLRGIPNRNNLILTGDFNCSLARCAPAVGTGGFLWQGAESGGTVHTDQSTFVHLLRNFGLVALNTWCMGLGPTYVHGQQASRIDYVCVRQMFADGLAKQVKYLWHSPFLFQTTHGHVPILSSIARHWIPSHDSNRTPRVTMQQRQAGRQAFVDQTSVWQQFVSQTQEIIRNSFGAPTSDVDTQMTCMHQQVLQSFCDFFPAGRKTPRLAPWEQNLPVILNKWEHRRRLQKLWRPTQVCVFQAWFHVIKFTQLKRAHAKAARCTRTRLFQEVVHTASQAAVQHDTHKLFQIINSYAPKNPRKQIQLRNHEGHMATPIESAAILNKFVHDIWAGPATIELPFREPPGVPFTVRQLETALAGIPATKAVAKPYAPGVVWKQLAVFLAPLLHAQMNTWWQQVPPRIPEAWRHAYLFMIPKPGKPPVSPYNLRPLALQEPVGKAVIGLLIKLAMQDAYSHMVHFPIWAYMNARSTLDAIRRVCAHCEEVRQMIRHLRSTPHSRAANCQRHQLYGGLQLCLDLQRAFDSVNRQRLFQRLAQLNVRPSIVQLLTAWHENTVYFVQHEDTDCPIGIGKGVRQGCKAAPGLWNSFLVLFLHDLMAHVSLRWLQTHLTIYADDLHLGVTFKSLEAFYKIHSILGVLFSTLQSLDMCINPAKSVVILEMKGSQSRFARRQFVHHDNGVARFKIEVPDSDPVYIPLQQSIKYLEVIISYGNFEDDSLKHRLTLMHVGFHRLQRWLTGRHGLSPQQRFRLWQTCIYPIFCYGVFATGVTTHGIQLAITKMTIMIRKMIRDHAYLTRRTNHAALDKQHIPAPLQLLLHTTWQLARSTHDRLEVLHPHDLVRTVNWSHLTTIIHLLESMQATGSLERSLTTLFEAGSAPLYQCELCDFCTDDVSAFRRHCTIEHDRTMNRTVMASPSDFAVDGLPTCKHCGKSFTTWRVFRIHIERGCQVLYSGLVLQHWVLQLALLVQLLCLRTCKLMQPHEDCD